MNTPPVVVAAISQYLEHMSMTIHAISSDVRSAHAQSTIGALYGLCSSKGIGSTSGRKRFAALMRRKMKPGEHTILQAEVRAVSLQIVGAGGNASDDRQHSN